MIQSLTWFVVSSAWLHCVLTILQDQQVHLGHPIIESTCKSFYFDWWSVPSTGIFHVLFALFVLSHSLSLSLKILAYQATYTHSKPFCLLILFIDKLKMCVLNSRCSQHNVYTTTGNPFQTRQNNKLCSVRVRPQARPSKTTPPPGSENWPYHSSRSWPRCLPHRQPCGWSTQDESTQVHQSLQELFLESQLSSGSVAGEESLR